MRNNIGALLTKISAIINFVIAGLVFIAGIVAAIGLGFLDTAAANFSWIFIIIAIISLVAGLLLWHAYKKMLAPRTIKTGAIWAIVLGVITLGNLSGVLALIGGILALVESEK